MPASRKTLDFDPADPPRILVEMQVTRMQRHTSEKAAQIWGYVGDYEVAITLPSSDGRVQSLAQLHKVGQQLGNSETAK